VLRPTTKSVDASVLLARTVTPEPMRPGWARALAMSASALPHRRLSNSDARLEAGQQALWSVPELQELLDEWIIACGQNRLHDRLRQGRPSTINPPLIWLAVTRHSP
jgi:hypothetical protein